jgi:hypothetical protein
VVPFILILPAALVMMIAFLAPSRDLPALFK